MKAEKKRLRAFVFQELIKMGKIKVCKVRMGDEIIPCYMTNSNPPHLLDKEKIDAMLEKIDAMLAADDPSPSIKN